MTDSLKFVYKGFLQSVEIQIFCEPQSEGIYRAFCEAKLKLPILKKNFTTWTTFSTEDHQWQEHSPVCEQGQEEKKVTKDSFSGEAEDPIGFFLKIHRREWQGDKVSLVVGAREVPLQLSREKNQITVSRAEKNQTLVIKMGHEGIEALEIPVPVLGSLRVQRVF